MNFPTQFRKHQRFTSCTGNPIKKKYIGRYNERGQLVLDEAGEENVYEYIQSFKESTDLKTIIRRFTNGETDVLSKVQGFYADVTEMPGTYADMLNVVTSGEEAFNKLPLEVKNKFGQNFGEFVATMGSSDWFEKLGVKSDAFIPNDVAETANKPEAVTE